MDICRTGSKSAMAKMFVIGVLLAGICLLGCNNTVFAQKTGWSMNKKGRVFYYDEEGNKTTGNNVLIGEKYYCFDKKGRQRVGWVRYRGNYYYYNIAPKKKGYLVCKKTVNGIKINSKGIAVSNKDKARLLAAANEIVFSITNFKMNQAKKNKACFMYVRDKLDWRNLTGFRSDLKKWDQHYAGYGIYKGYGDCYTGGCEFAYLAAASGAKKVYAESSGGHGWAEINGRYFDPNCSWSFKNVGKYYNVPASLSGRGGRPSWASHKSYVKRVD